MIGTPSGASNEIFLYNTPFLNNFLVWHTLQYTKDDFGKIDPRKVLVRLHKRGLGNVDTSKVSVRLHKRVLW